MRRLLGLDAKTRQYVEGSAFVRGVVERVGIDDFNAVWTGRADVADPAELGDPGRLGHPRPRLTPAREPVRGGP